MATNLGAVNTSRTPSPRTWTTVTLSSLLHAWRFVEADRHDLRGSGTCARRTPQIDPVTASRLEGDPQFLADRDGLVRLTGKHQHGFTQANELDPQTISRRTAGGRTDLGSQRVSSLCRTPTRSSSLPATKSTTSSTVVGFR